ncbi:MAG: methyltransferase family protein [Solirubrobacterales bacterium]
MTSASGPPVWRQLLSVLLLPTSVAIVIPVLLVSAYGVEVGWELPGVPTVLVMVVGAMLILGGLRLAIETIALFGKEGEGTLAPWDPTRKLVVRGPYRRVRNPMITGVGLVLLGEAAILGSPAILIVFGIFALANLTYIPLIEEPDLVARFGPEYEEYRRAVPRWIPRVQLHRGEPPGD